MPQSTTLQTRGRKNVQNPLDFNFLKRYTSAKPMRGHKYPRNPLLSQRAPHLLRAAQSSCGREWALEGKPNRAARRAVGATESGSVIKAGMCWHITRGRGANPAKIGWHRRSNYHRSCPNARTVFWDRSVFYLFAHRSCPAIEGPRRFATAGPERTKPYEDRCKHPVQVLSGRIRAAHGMVQCAGRYEKTSPLPCSTPAPCSP